MDDDGEQFSLRWNNFHTNLSSGFQELLEDKNLVDVTLACDGQYVQAHRAVLTVCSPYFKSLFKVNPNNHPIIILKDVNFTDLKSILQFMYKGEVNVKQDDLNTFLKTAEVLKVKGLTGDDSKENTKSVTQLFQDSQPPQAKKRKVVEQSAKLTPPPPQPLLPSAKPVPATAGSESHQTVQFISMAEPKEESSYVLDDDDDQNYSTYGDESLDLESQISMEPTGQPDMRSPLDLEGGSGHTSFQGANSRVKGDPNSKYHPCPFCSRVYSWKQTLTRHVADCHSKSSGPVTCDLCGKSYKNKSSLISHCATRHCKK